MAYVAHYLFLVFVLLNGAYYWFVFTGSLVRSQIDRGFIEPEGATGVFWLLQHPVLPYVVLFLCLPILAKEIMMSSLRSKFFCNLAFLVLVLFLYTVNTAWVVTR